MYQIVHSGSALYSIKKVEKIYENIPPGYALHPQRDITEAIEGGKGNMERKPIAHVQEEKLEDYAVNALFGPELASVEEHLLVCNTCQDKLEEVERYTKAMQAAAVRIRLEKSAMPLFPSAWNRFRGWVPAPLPVFSGAFAMIAMLVVFGVNRADKPDSPVDVELQAVRGDARNTAKAGHPLRLRLDARGVPQMPVWNIDILNAEGATLWTGTGTGSEPWIRASVAKSFTPGNYFVRLLKNDHDVIREYQLFLRKP